MMAPQDENKRLRQQCAAAWSQVTGLKEFLNDYGMVWVGPADVNEEGATKQVCMHSKQGET